MNTKENILFLNNTSNDDFDSLTNDILFKETYGNRHNRLALEHFLEDYFDYPAGFLHNKLAVSYESHLNKTRIKDIAMRGDLIVVIDNNILVDLEMYSTFTKDSLRKSKSYIMRIYSTQLDRGDNYSDIKKVTQINFVDKVKIKIKEEVISNNYLIDEPLSDDFEIDIVRLDLLDKKGYNLSERFKKQLQFLSAKSYEERKRISEGDEILMDLNTWIEQYKNDESLREFFDERKWSKFFGKNEGREEGKEERNYEIAQNLLNTPLSIKEIATATGLSIEEVTKLQNKKND